MFPPFVAAIQSTQTLAWWQSSAGWSLGSVQFACQTDLTGVPSQGQCWERLKTVKMATVTGSWHSLHLGMMSTFDILWPFPKIIIPAQHRRLLLQVLVMNILHHPPPFQSTPDFHLCLSSSLFLWLFLHLPKMLFSLSFSSAHHPSSAPSSAPFYSLYLHLSPVQSSLLALLGYIRLLELQPQFWFHLSTFHLLPIAFLFFSVHLSVYMSALSPFSLIPVISSIKCFCIPPIAAFLFYSCMALCFSCLLHVTQSHRVNSSFIRLPWNLWCWKDELD